MTDNNFILSTPLSQENAVLFSTRIADREGSAGSKTNKIVERFIPKDVFCKFQEKLGSYCMKKDIDDFYELNDKYKAQSLKLMPLMSGKVETEGKEAQAQSGFQLS